MIFDNQIIEDGRGMDYPTYEYEGENQMLELFRVDRQRIEGDYQIHVDQQLVYQSAPLHNRLQKDLIDLIWSFYENQ